MNRSEQFEFIRDLVRAVGKSVRDDIENGKIPEKWDGHELRELLADRFAAERGKSIVGSRKREYRKTVLVNNL